MSHGFEIFAVPVAGSGKLGICQMPGLSGDLASDLSTIADWKPTVVLSMTEVHEMSAHGCAEIGARLTALGIEWAHIPIQDFGGPTASSAQSWRTVSTRLHAVLDDGGRVLVHCRGGQGRSGMMALRIMVERGEDAETALSRLRAVRPRAVETEEQHAWASTI